MRQTVFLIACIPPSVDGRCPHHQVFFSLYWKETMRRCALNKRRGLHRSEKKMRVYWLDYGWSVGRFSLKWLYRKEGNHLLIFCVFSRDCSSNISQKYKLGNFWEYFRRFRKGSISLIDVYMANGLFLYSLEYSQKFPGWWFYEMLELPSHKNTEKIYKCLSSLW
jgi:hypothetical protein